MSTRRGSATEAKLDAVFSALAHPARRKILVRLEKGGVASMTELAAPFRMTLPAVSKHVRVLERAGLVRRSRDGWYHRFGLEARPLGDAAAFLDRWRPFWEATLDELARYLEPEGEPR